MKEVDEYRIEVRILENLLRIGGGISPAKHVTKRLRP
jgi:hypothetical protein